MKVSKRQLENQYFREMLLSFSEKTSEGGILTKAELVKYVHTEFEVLLHLVKKKIKEKVEQSKGN